MILCCMSQTLKTLAFQGKPIYYLADSASPSLVLIRPLCEALSVDADWQIRQLKADGFLGGEVCEYTTRLPSEDRARPYTCLPEEFIYGWVGGIQLTNTMRPETKATLTAYKRECYDLLYQHFHGRLKQVLELDKQAALVSVELQAVEKRLAHKLHADPDYQRKLDLEARQQQLRRSQRQGRQQNRQLAIEYALGV